MVSALNSSPGQAVSVGVLTGDIMLFLGQNTLTSRCPSPPGVQTHKWVRTNLIPVVAPKG